MKLKNGTATYIVSTPGLIEVLDYSDAVRVFSSTSIREGEKLHT
jgi:hypothetical protein